MRRTVATCSFSDSQDTERNAEAVEHTRLQGVEAVALKEAVKANNQGIASHNDVVGHAMLINVVDVVPAPRRHDAWGKLCVARLLTSRGAHTC